MSTPGNDRGSEPPPSPRPYPGPHPVRLDGELAPELSRWLWLVKWVLLIPHYIVLFFLWLAFLVVTVIAFFAVLITARYPRPLFDFNTGVLRWAWRVAFYGYGALGTDRYPPFRLAEQADYPAHFSLPYPERLSRGLVLVKWWLLAVPHYLVVGFFLGSGYSAEWSGGLILLLVLFAGVALLFANVYPRGIFDFVLGMNRWVFRVMGYAALLTDRYPPFRIDLGGADPGGPRAERPPAAQGPGAGT